MALDVGSRNRHASPGAASPGVRRPTAGMRGRREGQRSKGGHERFLALRRVVAPHPHAAVGAARHQQRVVEEGEPFRIEDLGILFGEIHRANLPVLERLGLGGNDIGVEGAKAIAAVLKDSKLSELGCAASRSHDPTHPMCQPPMNTFLPFARSLSGNQLCGLNDFGFGTYTAEGITALCEGLKGSAVTSLT